MGDIFEIERVLDSIVEKNVRYYFVRWKGYGPADDTWEPEDNLDACGNVLRRFWKSYKTKDAEIGKRSEPQKQTGAAQKKRPGPKKPGNSSNSINSKKSSRKSTSSSVETEKPVNKKISKLKNDQKFTAGDISKKGPQTNMDSSPILFFPSSTASTNFGKIVTDKVKMFENTETMATSTTKAVAATQRKSSSHAIDEIGIRACEKYEKVVTNERESERKKCVPKTADSTKLTNTYSSENIVVNQDSVENRVIKTSRDRKRKNSFPTSLSSTDASNNFKPVDAVDGSLPVTVKKPSLSADGSHSPSDVTRTDKPQKRKRTSVSDSTVKKEMKGETMPSQQLVSNSGGALERAKIVKEIQEHIKKGIMLKKAMLAPNTCEKSSFTSHKSMFELGTPKLPSQQKGKKQSLSKNPVPSKTGRESSGDSSGSKFESRSERDKERKLSKSSLVSPKTSSDNSSGPKLELGSSKKAKERYIRYICSKSSEISPKQYRESSNDSRKSVFEFATGKDSKEMKSKERFLSESMIVSPKTSGKSPNNKSSPKFQYGSSKKLENQDRKYILSKSSIVSPKTYGGSSNDSSGSVSRDSEKLRGVNKKHILSKSPVISPKVCEESSGDGCRSKSKLGVGKDQWKPNTGIVSSKSQLASPKICGESSKFDFESSKEPGKQVERMVSSKGAVVSPKSYLDLCNSSSDSQYGHGKAKEPKRHNNKEVSSKGLDVSPKTDVEYALFGFTPSKNEAQKKTSEQTRLNTSESVKELKFVIETPKVSTLRDKTLSDNEKLMFARKPDEEQKKASERKTELDKKEKKSSGNNSGVESVVKLDREQTGRSGKKALEIQPTSKKLVTPKEILSGISSESKLEIKKDIKIGKSGKETSPKLGGMYEKSSESSLKHTTNEGQKAKSVSESSERKTHKLSCSESSRSDLEMNNSRKELQCNKNTYLKKCSIPSTALVESSKNDSFSEGRSDASGEQEKINLKLQQNLQVKKKKYFPKRFIDLPRNFQKTPYTNKREGKTTITPELNLAARTEGTASDSQLKKANDSKSKEMDKTEMLLSQRISDPANVSGESTTVFVDDSKPGKTAGAEVTLLSKLPSPLTSKVPSYKSSDSQLAKDKESKEVNTAEVSFRKRLEKPIICKEQDVEAERHEQLSLSKMKNRKLCEETPGLPNKNEKSLYSGRIAANFEAANDKNGSGVLQEDKSTSEEWTDPPKLCRKSSSESAVSEFELKMSDNDDTLDSIPELASVTTFSNKITNLKSSSGRKKSSLDEVSASIHVNITDSCCKLAESPNVSTESLPELSGELQDTSRDIGMAKINESRPNWTDATMNVEKNKGFVVEMEDLQSKGKKKSVRKPEGFIFDPRKTIGFNEDLDTQRSALPSEQVYSVKQRFISVKDLTLSTAGNVSLTSTDITSPFDGIPKPNDTSLKGESTIAMKMQTASNRYDKNDPSAVVKPTAKSNIVDSSEKGKLITKESQSIVSETQLDTNKPENNGDQLSKLVFSDSAASSGGGHEKSPCSIFGKRKHENLSVNEDVKNKVPRHTQESKRFTETSLDKESKLTGERSNGRSLGADTSNLDSLIGSTKMKVKDNVDKKKRLTALEKKVGEVKLPKNAKDVKDVGHKQPQQRVQSPIKVIGNNPLSVTNLHNVDEEGITPQQVTAKGLDHTKTTTTATDNRASSFCKPPLDIDSYTNIDDKSVKEKENTLKAINVEPKLCSVSTEKELVTGKNTKSGGTKNNTTTRDEKLGAASAEFEMKTVMDVKKQATQCGGGEDKTEMPSHVGMTDEDVGIQQSIKKRIKDVRLDKKMVNDASLWIGGPGKSSISNIILNKLKEIKRKINVPKSSFTGKELIPGRERIDAGLNVKPVQKLSEVVQKELFTFTSNKPEAAQLNQDKSSHKGIRLSPVTSEIDGCGSKSIETDIGKTQSPMGSSTLVSMKNTIPNEAVSSEMKSGSKSKRSEPRETSLLPNTSDGVADLSDIASLTLGSPKITTPIETTLCANACSVELKPTDTSKNSSTNNEIPDVGDDDSLTHARRKIVSSSEMVSSLKESSFEAKLAEATETSQHIGAPDVTDIDSFQEQGSPELPNFHQDRFDDAATMPLCYNPGETQESATEMSGYDDLEMLGSPELPNFHKEFSFGEKEKKHSRECATPIKTKTEISNDEGKDAWEEDEITGSPELPHFHHDLCFDSKTEQPVPTHEDTTKVGEASDMVEELKIDDGDSLKPVGALVVSPTLDSITDQSIGQNLQKCDSGEQASSQKRNPTTPELPKQEQETKIEEPEVEPKDSVDTTPIHSPKQTADVQDDFEDNTKRTDSSVTYHEEPSNEDISFSDMIVIDEEVYHSSPDDFQYSSPDEFFVKDMIGESDSEEQISFINHPKKPSSAKSKTITKTRSTKRTATLIITSDSEDEGRVKLRSPKKQRVDKDKRTANKAEENTSKGNAASSVSNTKTDKRKADKQSEKSVEKKREEKSSCDVVTRIIEFSELSTGKKSRKNKKQDSDAKKGDSDFEFDLDDYNPSELTTEKAAVVRVDKGSNTSTGVPITIPFADVKLAIKKGDTSTLLSTLAGGLDIESRDNVAGMTLLMRAVVVAQSSVVKLLILRGANVDARDNAGNTPLMLASVLGLVSIAKLLLDAGADVNAKQISNGETSLVKACMKGFYEMVCVLLTRGADTQARCRGFTTAQIATNCGHYYITNLLEEHNKRLQNCVVKAVTSCLGHEQSMITPPLLPHVCLYPNDGQKFTQYFSCDDSLIDKTILLYCFRASYAKNGEVRLGFSSDNGVQTVTLNGVTQEPVLKNNRCVFKLYPKVDRNKMVIQTYQSRIQLVVCIYAADLKAETLSTDIT